jgi:hypothetical protein
MIHTIIDTIIGYKSWRRRWTLKSELIKAGVSALSFRQVNCMGILSTVRGRKWVIVNRF